MVFSRSNIIHSLRDLPKEMVVSPISDSLRNHLQAVFILYTRLNILVIEPVMEYFPVIASVCPAFLLRRLSISVKLYVAFIP